TLPENLAISPSEPIASFSAVAGPPLDSEGTFLASGAAPGLGSVTVIWLQLLLPVDLHVGVEAQHHGREDQVEDPDPGEGDDDGLVHRATHTDRSTGGAVALVGAHDADDQAEQGGLGDAAGHVGRGGVGP